MICRRFLNTNTGVPTTLRQLIASFNNGGIVNPHAANLMDSLACCEAKGGIFQSELIRPTISVKNGTGSVIQHVVGTQIVPDGNGDCRAITTKINCIFKVEDGDVVSSSFTTSETPL